MTKILVVDDEKNICRTVGMVLTGEDYDVETTQDGQEGLKIIADGDVDVVLLDVQLGNMSGLDMLETIRKAPNAPEIIMMSGQIGRAHV